MRRTSPALVSARRTSYTAWWDTSPEWRRTTSISESVSACGWSCTAASTATRGRVTRRATWRSMPSSSAVVGIALSLPQNLERFKSESERQQRVLDDLGQCRVDPVLAPHHLRYRHPEAHRLDQRLDQRGRLVAHEVRADQGAAR